MTRFYTRPYLRRAAMIAAFLCLTLAVAWAVWRGSYAQAERLFSDAIRQGVVALPTGAWFGDPGGNMDPHGNPNTLTRDLGTSRLGQGCSAHTALVDVAKLDA